MLGRSPAIDRLDSLDVMDRRIRSASAVTADLVSDLVAAACRRLPVLEEAGTVTRIRDLMAAGAWTDLALALVEIGAPGWSLRRLVLDDGRWLCSLSRQANFPAWLDETADGSHEVLPLAILSALVEAQRHPAEPAPQPAPVASADAARPANAIVCDNFA